MMRMGAKLGLVIRNDDDMGISRADMGISLICLLDREAFWSTGVSC